MCTSLTLPLPDGRQLFGRTLDWHEHFSESPISTPRAFPFDYGCHSRSDSSAGVHIPLPRTSLHALCGMATEIDGYPLYADALNEQGLAMAGLRFAESAFYLPMTARSPLESIELAPWELIPYILGLCATISEAREALTAVRVVDIPFRTATGYIPTTPLHWHIAGKTADEGSLTVEATASGLQVYNNPLGVLTNDPSFPTQLAAYEQSILRDAPLPTDYTSMSRFIRAASLMQRTSEAMEAMPEDNDPTTCFFNLAATVSPPKGAVASVEGTGWQTTLYTSCMDGTSGLYTCVMASQPDIVRIRF